MNIVVYNPSTGEIVRNCGRMPNESEGFSFIVTESIVPDTDYYVVNEVIVEKATASPTVTESGGVYTINGLPTVFSMIFRNQWYEVDDGVLEMTFDTPGIYTLLIQSVTHKPLEVTVDAT